MTAAQSELLSATRRRQWEKRVQDVRGWALANNATAAETIPPALFEILAEDRVWVSTRTDEWVVGWHLEDGELVPERPIELHIESGYCWGDQGRHLVEISSMADLECMMNEGLDLCGCSACDSNPDADAAYDDWKVW